MSSGLQASKNPHAPRSSSDSALPACTTIPTPGASICTQNPSIETCNDPDCCLLAVRSEPCGIAHR
ncbi:hypothetical protein BDU57DRAFT_519647 [Ampelomyces quisqualis]|uniref:Uncharacterized protein n=1 Tax=Ampelomyces quisqualis TaxID=50730 RepID=A0A6A5QKI0_AMPQU|nr:hypothetical protein BDU57DRAFT_519647 [Ampelomyces quisqualis]